MSALQARGHEFHPDTKKKKKENLRLEGSQILEPSASVVYLIHFIVQCAFCHFLCVHYIKRLRNSAEGRFIVCL